MLVLGGCAVGGCQVLSVAVVVDVGAMVEVVVFGTWVVVVAA